MRKFVTQLTFVEDQIEGIPSNGESMTVEQYCPSVKELYIRFANGQPVDAKIYPWGKSDSFEECPPMCVDFTDLEKAQRFVDSVKKQVADLEKRAADVAEKTSLKAEKEIVKEVRKEA